jgi:hypothetical protein
MHWDLEISTRMRSRVIRRTPYDSLSWNGMRVKKCKNASGDEDGLCTLF